MKDVYVVWGIVEHAEFVKLVIQDHSQWRLSWPWRTRSMIQRKEKEKKRFDLIKCHMCAGADLSDVELSGLEWYSKSAVDAISRDVQRALFGGEIKFGAWIVMVIEQMMIRNSKSRSMSWNQNKKWDRKKLYRRWS